MLLDAGHEAELRRGGFVAVEGYLTPDECSRLSADYTELAPSDDSGLVIDFLRPDRANVRRLSALATDAIDRQLPSVFADASVVVATFVAKHPGGESAMALHDEPTFVIEPDERTYNIWIPLCDVSSDLQNGALELVPRSPALATFLAGYNTPQLFRPHARALEACSVVPTVSAGTAIIYDSRMLHRSCENRTDRRRLAVAASIARRGVPLVHVVATGAVQRRVFAVDRAFFVEVHPATVHDGMPSGYPVIQDRPDLARVTPDALAEVLGIPVADVPPGDPQLPPDLDTGAIPKRLPTAPSLGGTRTVELHCSVEATAAEPSRSFAAIDIDGTALVQPLARVIPDEVSTRLRSLPRRDRLRLAAVRRNSALLVLDPGARVRGVVQGRADERHRIVPLGFPEVMAGVLTGDAAVNFEVGNDVMVDSGAAVTCWNDGPGQVVAILAPDRAKIVRPALAAVAAVAGLVACAVTVARRRRR